MNIKGLIHKNINFYARFYRLIAIAVTIMVTVIVGSLVVGDSVRSTLVRRVTERLGNTETIIFSRNAYMSEELLESSSLSTAKGYLLVNGFVSRNGKLIPVYVWGMDDPSVTKGKVKINPALSKELDVNNSEDLVLRLPAAGMVPSGSLFVTENYTTSLRLSFEGIISKEEGGNISMKNEQIIPLNVFVDREELAEVLEVKGKMNLILHEKYLSDNELNDAWNYTVSGLSVNRKDNFTEISSDRVFLQEKVVETIFHNHQHPNRLFSYLANSIEQDSFSIPYSFITAMDCYKEEKINKNEIILSDYSANRLNAKINDIIRITYYTSHDLKL